MNNNSTTQSNIPLYPNEAYKEESTKNAEQNGQNSNPLLPLLLSALSKDGGESGDLLKLLLSSSNLEGSQTGLVSALASSLLSGKKKTQQNVSAESKGERAFPKNEFI